MSFVKRPFRVSIWYPDDAAQIIANEALIAYNVNDNHDEIRVGQGYRAVAWYFDTQDHADHFADVATTELSRFSQFQITQP
jgi:hypothetical protein